ncbi:hypothetical protein JCM19274_813 [Algibacter lectus]|uniref:Uncharacterized protein n=1 Tax=Algibacter lectus TaxID=221126 RepID=A0A090WSJ1_9FLAO|nr:hypothetical protein JCM19274_813 [Algibacter lectus]
MGVTQGSGFHYSLFCVAIGATTQKRAQTSRSIPNANSAKP